VCVACNGPPRLLDALSYRARPVAAQVRFRAISILPTIIYNIIDRGLTAVTTRRFCLLFSKKFVVNHHVDLRISDGMGWMAPRGSALLYSYSALSLIDLISFSHGSLLFVCLFSALNPFPHHLS